MRKLSDMNTVEEMRAFLDSATVEEQNGFTWQELKAAVMGVLRLDRHPRGEAAYNLAAEIDNLGDFFREATALADLLLPEPAAETVIVSRHAGAIEWLARRDIVGEVIAQATPEDVRGRIVVGNLPLHLAALAVKVGSIDLPNLRADQRGRDLTPEEMDAAGAVIRWYSVAEVGGA